MNIKVKAIEVQLSDGQTVIVHEPKVKDMNVFLNALPALHALSESFANAQQATEGVQGMPTEIPQAALDGVFSLLAIMTDVTLNEFNELPLFDGLAIMKGLSVFTPKNPTFPAVEPEIPQTEPMIALITTP
ncbi:MAG: hypothetical protein L0287_09950 [Anaerolineae bacterium]|nr:hypothetical protein [Anaerolineae bacterium]